MVLPATSYDSGMLLVAPMQFICAAAAAATLAAVALEYVLASTGEAAVSPAVFGRPTVLLPPQLWGPDRSAVYVHLPRPAEDLQVDSAYRQ